MCCNLCPNYILCLENDKDRDDCCRQCPEYGDCIGSEEPSGVSETESEELDFS